MRTFKRLPGEMPPIYAPAIVMLAAIVVLSIPTCHTFQLQQTPADATALLAIQNQQQQQLSSEQQQAFKNLQQQAPSASAESKQASAAAKPPAIEQQKPAKSNHRLVNKIKDARHRRRNRHHRHRHHHRVVSASNNNNLNEKAAQLVGPQTTQNSHEQPQQQPTLTALESIVEEVARAGQMPTSQNNLISIAQQVNQQQQQLQQPVSGATTASEILLDGSSSPVSHLQQAPGGREPLHTSTSQQPAPQVQLLQPAQQQQQPVAVLPVTVANSPVATRGPTHNSRGFFLTSMLSKIMNVLNVTEFALEMRDGISSRASCMACNAVVGLFLSPLYSKEVFSAAIRTVCISFKIQTPRVCSGLAEAFQDDFEYIRKNTKLTRDEVCGVVFGVDCARRPTYNLFWTVPIPEMPVNKEIAATTTTGGSNALSIPMSEQAMTNMEDAPDLFEYRKSNGVQQSGVIANNKDKQQQQQNPASAASQQQLAVANQVSSSTTQSGSDPSANNPSAKAGKMLKRPKYIFDDELHLMDNDAGRNQRGGNNKMSTFVQITDIHIDPYYEAGSLNDCNEPLCCRATSGSVPPSDKRRRAGRWGDYGNCDVPVRTLQNALKRIREKHSDAEYWLWTGDISPHDIWNISKSETTSHVRLVSKLVREYSNGVPVFPVIGNHEAHPVNSFAPPEIKGKFSMSWLYDLLAEEWSEWLPADALRTLRIGGFYKLQVRKGFRIIALNTNYCARLNPWSFFDPVDPANQLKWLVDELMEAELNQDKVHIIGHVPPDNRECTQAWLFNFINIVDRFRDTILAQFYGHTHRDEWRLIYSLNRPSDEPIGIQYIGPSITPFTENNPAYRIYHQDKIGNVLDSETYYFNLTEANATPTSEPVWKFSYSTRAHLNMTQGLTPQEWNSYVQKMHDDDDLFDQFFKNFYRFSEPKAGQVCRAKCKYTMLSDLRLSHPYKTKPKPFFPHRKMSNHHGNRHDRDHHHHHHHKRLRHTLD